MYIVMSRISMSIVNKLFANYIGILCTVTESASCKIIDMLLSVDMFVVPIIRTAGCRNVGLIIFVG